MPRVEPVRCVCGRVAQLVQPQGELFRTRQVVCSNDSCFEGPWRATEYGAVQMWNRVMTAAKEAKDAE